MIEIFENKSLKMTIFLGIIYDKFVKMWKLKNP